MMNSKTIIALGLIALGVFSSCNETVDVAQERRATNEKAFHAFADSTDFQRITQPGIAGNGSIYMKVTKKGDEQVGIDYTDAVTLFRDAYLTSDWIKSNLNAQHLRQTLDLNSIQQETVASLPTGLRIAVEHLHPGAEASVVVPWYFNVNNATEPTQSYTSLYYRIRIGSVIKPSAN